MRIFFTCPISNKFTEKSFYTNLNSLSCLFQATDGVTCPGTPHCFNMEVRWVLYRTNESVVLSKSRCVWLLQTRAAKINSRQLPIPSPTILWHCCLLQNISESYEFFFVSCILQSRTSTFFVPHKSHLFHRFCQSRSRRIAWDS